MSTTALSTKPCEPQGPRAASPSTPIDAEAAPRQTVDLVLDEAGIDDHLQRAKVMIVDDETIGVHGVETQLCRLGYQNFVSSTASADALATIDHEQPDLVLLDIARLPDGDLDWLRQLRCDARWQGLPVIVLAAHGDAEIRRAALEAGCTDFLSKPVDPSELAVRVRNLLIAKVHHDRLAKQADQLESDVRLQAKALEEARHAAELRYHAGKAEIATEVLHNVGNALNSVNVGVNLVGSTVRNSKVLSLRRAVDLLREHEGNLSRFLTKDERGRVLPSYLHDVTDSLLKERDKMASEVELLTRHLEHIHAVVATQQRYAALNNVREEVFLDQLLGDVEELLGGSMAKHGIEIVRQYEQIPAVWTDRHKLLQVLLNVVKNATDSIKQAHRMGLGRLDLCISRRNEERAVICVKDNGVGIAPEILVKIFSHGFTTKRNGHGFGLHSCANIIKELGGSIQAQSEGAGKGATFILEVPFTRKGN